MSYCIKYTKIADGSRWKIIGRSLSSSIDGLWPVRKAFVFIRNGDFHMQIDLYGEIVHLDIFYQAAHILYYFWGRKNGPGHVALENNGGGLYLYDVRIDDLFVTVQEWEKWRDEHREVPHLTKSAAKCD